MRKAFGISAIVLLLVPTMSSCILDAEETRPDPGGPPPAYRPLNAKDNVLFNLELAYNQRDIIEFGNLLDPEPGAFVFHTSPTDVLNGLVKSSSWERAKELQLTGLLFSRRPPPPFNPAETIDLELNYTEGDDAWVQVTPATHPGEKWYEKPAEYHLTAKIGETTYTQNKTVIALFTVRFTEVEGDSVWQLATWRDDIGN